jgi:hypothetical protein
MLTLVFFVMLWAWVVLLFLMKMAGRQVGAEDVISNALIHVVMIALVVVGTDEYLH